MFTSQVSILLVEHDVLVADRFAEILSRNNWHITVAASGEQAVQIFDRDATIDLVILDMDLSLSGEGAEVAQRLQVVRPIPIVLLVSSHEAGAAGETDGIPHCGLLQKDAGARVIRSSVLNGMELFRARTASVHLHPVTGSRREEAALMGHEALRQLFEHMDEGFVLQELVYDEGGVAYDYRFLIANTAYERHTGQKPEEILGKTLLEVMPDADRAMIRKYCHVALSREPMRVEYFSKTFGRYMRVSTFSPAYGQFASIFEDISDRKRAEQALTDATAYNRLIFDTSPIGMVTYREDGTVIASNLATATITGGTIEAIRAQNFRSLDSWRSSGLLDAASDALASGRPAALEIRGRSTFGKDLWLSARFMPFTHAGERQLLAMFEDVSTQKENEQALRENEARYRTMFDMALDGIVIRDLTGRAVQVNPAFAAMHGYTREEILSLGHLDLLFPESIDRLPTYLTAVREGKEVHGLLHSKHRDGSRLVLDVAAKRITMQEQECILTFYRDVTDRARAEAALQESEERFRSMIESQSAVMFVVESETGDLIDANDPALAFYGYDRGTFLTKNIRDIDVTPSAALRARIDGISTGEIRHLEVQHRLADGRIRDVEAHASTFILHGRRVNFGIIYDVTERKHAEDRIRALLQEKEVLLKEVHHRIKNNMTTIASLLALQAGMLRDPASISALKDAESRVKSMVVLYDKLYRSESYRGLSTDSYLSALVDDIVRGSHTAATIRVVKDLVPFDLDTKRLSALSILVNELLTNSMKHAFVQGASGTLRLASERKPGAVVITVADDGVGLPPEDALRGDSFGLRLVHMLAEQIGATLKVSRDHGTEWTITLADAAELEGRDGDGRGST